MRLSRHQLLLLVLLTASSIGYVCVGYVVTREQSEVISLVFTILFAAYGWLVLTRERINIRQIVTWAVVFRILFLLSFPVLSDDIYRFIWDGYLLNAGINPFSHLPAFYLENEIQIPGITTELYKLLNSPTYYTVYPPLAQFIFWIATWAGEAPHTGAIVIRVFIIAAEVASLQLMMYLLRVYRLPARNVLIYALNPLVIIELTGNLHFEAFMILFLLLAMFCLVSNRVVRAGMFMAASVASKLIPLMLLPLFIKRLKFKKLVYFYLSTGAFIILFFLPLLSNEFLTGMSDSIGLYFQKFEFNASIYYLLREVGFLITGYNTIAVIGKMLPIVVVAGIVLLTVFNRQSTWHAMLWSLTLYLLLSTTVHPWYIATLVGLSVFTSYRFPAMWSWLIMYTYLGYSADGFSENYWVITIEYFVVIAYLIYEIYESYQKRHEIPHQPAA